MMPSNHVVSVKANGGWAVRKYGSSRATKIFKTKEEAVSYGRKISRSEKTILYIHKMDGRIQSRNSYARRRAEA